jgi:hypothetical protein
MAYGFFVFIARLSNGIKPARSKLLLQDCEPYVKPFYPINLAFISKPFISFDVDYREEMISAFGFGGNQFAEEEEVGD